MIVPYDRRGGVREQIYKMGSRKEVVMKTKPFKIAMCILLVSLVAVPVLLMAAEKINLNTATLEELTLRE